MKKLVSVVRSLITFSYKIFKYKSLRPIRFFFYRNRNIKRTDNHLLLTRISYEGHHLEKAVKHEYSESCGQDRALLLEKLLIEAKTRKLEQQRLINWTEGILTGFRSKQKNKKPILIQPPIGNLSIKEVNQDVIDAIINRRSVRFWLAKPLEPKLLEKIVEAGINGPFSCNRQALKIGIIEHTTEEMQLGNSSNKSMLSKAPVILYVAIDRRLYYEKYAPSLDAGSFCANALLAVEVLGLGGCWVYQCETVRQRKLRKQFGLPRHYYFYSALLIGYPAEKPGKPARKNIESLMRRAVES